MELDLDKILSFFKPKQLAVTYDGKRYPLKRLEVMHVASLEKVGDAVGNESPEQTSQRLIDFLRDLFVEDAPAFLNKKLSEIADAGERNNVVLMATALLNLVRQIFVAEHNDQKKLQLAAEEADRQITAASETMAASTISS